MKPYIIIQEYEKSIQDISTLNDRFNEVVLNKAETKAAISRMVKRLKFLDEREQGIMKDLVKAQETKAKHATKYQYCKKYIGYINKVREIQKQLNKINKRV